MHNNRSKMSNPISVKSSKTRPTIGVTIHHFPEWDVWLGAAQAAEAFDVNLIGLVGERLQAPGFLAQSNVLYDLVTAERFDGLIVWGSMLSTHVGVKELQRFCQRYRPLPLVSASAALTGMPSVLIDNYQGMHEAMTHLLEVHGYRRIAFIRAPQGNPEGEERYRAYRDALVEHNLPVDEQLVVYGDWLRASGVAVVDELLDKRQVQFEAMVAADDEMAYGALEALQARGIRTPDEVAVVGFDDQVESRFTTPPLTTVRQLREKVGWRAVETVLALLAGEAVPEQVKVPTELIVRQSCGCLSPRVMQAAVGPAPLAAETLAARREDFLAEIMAGAAAGLARGEMEDLLDAFAAEIEGQAAGVFLPTLAEILRQADAKRVNMSQWQGLLSTLRRHALPCLREPTALARAEDLWQQGRVLIGETMRWAQGRRDLQATRRVETLQEVSQLLATTLRMTELAEVLAEQLPRVGINRCYLSLYEESASPGEWARLVLACDEGKRVEAAAGQRFPSCRLAPDEVWPVEQRYTLLVEPLYFREHQLGLALFEASLREGQVYEALRGQLSSALEVILLSMRNADLYEEALKARTAAEEANQLKSRFLAMVSHELRTPLSLIIGTIEMMLQEKSRRLLLEPFRQDIANIRASAQHLFHLIGDVLDLASSQAGELRLTREPLNLGEILEEVVLLGESLAREKGLGWRTTIPRTLPLVWGDRTRLRQVTLNLVSNAVKFTEQGEVTVNVEGEGQEVTVSVSDTGIGIPPEEQGAIFDEFHQSGRTTERGYGGIGLGLAITRRLVELHGGRIGVRSSGEEGTGSTFYFTLPVLSAPVAPAEKTNFRTRTVLLLTGQAEGGKQLHEYLARRGFEVEVLATDENADWLTQIVTSPPGAVVLDFQPAAERGWELMRILKANPATQEVPVVFYSLLEGESGSVLGLEHLTKPVGSAELARALERQGLEGQGCKEGRTILVVDDEPAILDLHARLVRLHLPECRVLKAYNGREALAIMEQERLDLVLLDLMMPEMSGVEVLEKMREREMTRDVPVIVLTGQVFTAQDMAQLRQGVTAVMGKGLFSAAEVLAQVETALARNNRLGSEAQRVVRQAMAYIHEHYTEPVTREELARHLLVNERYLTRCFHHETGVTPMTYLKRFRVKQAKALLAKGNLSITEVAMATGFSDSSYFGRIFRQEEGISPSAYQQGKR